MRRCIIVTAGGVATAAAAVASAVVNACGNVLAVALDSVVLWVTFAMVMGYGVVTMFVIGAATMASVGVLIAVVQYSDT